MTYSLVILNWENRIIHMNTYSGENCGADLITELLDIEPTLLKMLSQEVPMKLSSQEERQFATSKVCHICESPLGEERHRDHDHLTGKFLGAAHPGNTKLKITHKLFFKFFYFLTGCNLNRQVPHRIPIYCHNFQGKNIVRTLLHVIKR